MAHPEFQVTNGKDNQFYFSLTAKNSQVIFSSQGYKSKVGCENGMISVKKNASNKKNFERKESKDGSHYFVLKAANSKVIGKSQMYITKESMENGIESVRENAKTATVNYI